jgi:hypothetical protein
MPARRARRAARARSHAPARSSAVANTVVNEPAAPVVDGCCSPAEEVVAMCRSFALDRDGGP